MKKSYVTKKQVNFYIENTLKRFDSLETFRNEVNYAIEDLDNGSNPNQVKFLKRVIEVLN